MYTQKTIVKNSAEELDKEINRLYGKGYQFVGAPVMSRNGETFMQTVLIPVDNHAKR
jgi:hypothetical protein